MGQIPLICDGCGQAATPEHISNRLKRLEQATRYRPIHIQTLYLGVAPPASTNEFLYSASEDGFHGEGAELLKKLDIVSDGKRTEAVLVEFQRNGCFLAHVLECPFKANLGQEARAELLRKRLPVAIMRIKRSLRPKRVTLISSELDVIAVTMHEAIGGVEFGMLARGATCS